MNPETATQTVIVLLAATQDIAVDGWAVSTLAPGQLGPANAVQVVGYKLGMLTGGGLLVWAAEPGDDTLTPSWPSHSNRR